VSVTRPFKWECNQCGRTEEKTGYGFPTGWSWYGGTVREPEVKHRCDQCTDLKVHKLESELDEAVQLIAELRAELVDQMKAEFGEDKVKEAIGE
jgi:hypothetical protein